MNFNLLVFIKGMIVGGTMLVPGVSGGSMAMILGIYHKLLCAVSGFFQNWKNNVLFLGIFLSGGILGIVLFAKPMLNLIENHRMIMMYFFIGAAAGGVPLILKSAQLKKFHWKYILYLALGALFIAGINLLPTGLLRGQTENAGVETVFLIIAGFIAAIALVLPGISVSYFLLLLGLYDHTIQAVNTGNLLFLFSLGIGSVLGILATTRILDWIMRCFPQATYLVISGFILASLVEIFPGVPAGAEVLLCIIVFIMGFGCIYILSRKELSCEENTEKPDKAE